MSKADLTDISHIEFTSRVFPTDEDMALWNSLSAEHQRALILRDVEEGLASGVSDLQSVSDIVKSVRAETKHAG
jgi:hypothetical protein